MRLDWVVNEDTYGILATNTVPVNTIAAVPLTYPRFMFDELMGGPGISRRGGAFPDGKKQFCKAVVGHVCLSTPTWAIGSTLVWHFRIVKKPMDFLTAAAITDPAYSIADDIFANERFVWQEIMYDSFTFGQPIRTTLRVRASVNQWLEPDEALWFVIDLATGAAPFVNTARLDYRPYLRTLMKADS